MTTDEQRNAFRVCPNCGRRWPSRPDFLGDPCKELAGYQVHFRTLELGLFLFNHRPCGTTFALKAGTFADLYDGPVYVERKTGSEECGGLCNVETELRRCPAQCECAWVREVIQIVSGWPVRT